MKVSAQQCDVVAKSLSDPFEFFRTWLGIADSRWTPDQVKIIEAVRDHKHVMVTSGNGVGKSFCAAAIILWYLYSNHNSKVISTSSSYAQLSDALWSEIRTLHANARRKLGGKLLTMKIEPDPSNPTWSAVGISTDSAESFQGRHAPHVLVLMDEGVGVEGKIFEASELMTYGPEDRFVVLANPTDSTSYMYQESEVEGKWYQLEISAENHPNYLQRKTVIPGAVSYERVIELEKQYGRDHPLYQARVLGKWSKQLGRLLPQFERPPGRHTFDPEVTKLDPWLSWFASCDIGFAHDSAVLWGRFDGRTTWIVRELVKPGLDARQLAQSIAELTNPKGTERKDTVKLDFLALSFDAFNKTDGPRSRAQEMGEELRKRDLPYPMPAKRDRIDGINVLRTMLNNDTLKVSLNCPRLIDSLKKILVNPDRPEDALKQDGDDPFDSLRYLLTATPRLVPTPLEIAIEDATAPLKEKNDYLSAMIKRAMMIDKAKVDVSTFSFGRYMRRGRPSA